MVPEETGVCEYCGSAVEHDVNVPPPARDRASERIERFDRLAEHPSFDKWMRWRPAQRETTSSGVNPAVIGAGFIVVGIAIGLGVTSSHPPAPIAILPFVLVGLGVRTFIRANRASSEAAAPAKAYSALVVAKRTDVTTGEYGGTSYFVTMEFRSGTRREYGVDGEFYGLVSDDDIGVAYIREGDLLNFKKIDV
jgi:hypothetical protein